jgi:hypothetical protein
MPARFVKIRELQGFDDKADPDWMMVPKGGMNSCYLEGATNLELRCEPAGVATVKFGKKKAGSETIREVLVTGVKTNNGTPTKIVAHQKGAVKAEVEIDVYDRLRVNVGVNFVSDNAKHKTIRVQADAEKIFKVMNEIFTSQANIELWPHTYNPCPVPTDLGTTIMMGSDEVKQILKAKKAAKVDLNVFFVWGIVDNDDVCDPDGMTCKGSSTLAFQSKNNAMIEDIPDLTRAGIILAHEAGHFLGYRHGRMEKSAGNLMYYKPTKKEITRNQVRIFRNRSNWGQSPPPFGVK